MKFDPPSVYVELAQVREQRDRVAEANVRLARQVRVLEMRVASLQQHRELKGEAYDNVHAVAADLLEENAGLEADRIRQAHRIGQLEAGIVRLHDRATWPFIPAGQVRAACQQILRGEA